MVKSYGRIGIRKDTQNRLDTLTRTLILNLWNFEFYFDSRIIRRLLYTRLYYLLNVRKVFEAFLEIILPLVII